jgi:hypothetical protein
VQRQKGTTQIITDFLKFVGQSGQKITRTSNTAKHAGPGVRQNFLFVYFVLHRKSEMQLVCWNDHGQLGIRFCFKWNLLLKHATVSMVILIFASQGLRSALLIFTLGIIRRIFKVTRWRFICNAASGSCNQSEHALQKAHAL